LYTCKPAQYSCLTSCAAALSLNIKTHIGSRCLPRFSHWRYMVVWLHFLFSIAVTPTKRPLLTLPISLDVFNSCNFSTSASQCCFCWYPMLRL
jgi:hypothetical protein